MIEAPMLQFPSHQVATICASMRAAGLLSDAQADTVLAQALTRAVVCPCGRHASFPRPQSPQRDHVSCVRWAATERE